MMTDMAPPSPIEGQMYIDERDEQTYVYSDGSWMRIASAIEAIEHYEAMMEGPRAISIDCVDAAQDNRWESIANEL